ncbi:MAG: FAD-binding oxidoreductase, partial [Actinomycetota bacterium]|nr:FAD-binding oxidoreductase [Actinomycetota bacterium]
MRGCAKEGASLRPVGSRTKLRWGRTTPVPDLELATDRLNRVLEHNAGDFTAVVQPGVKLAEAQRIFAGKDQMLALDPPLQGSAATLGGIVATGDSGPLRHRFNAARDLILGITVALSDGTVARAGGQVIKNVAGYDLGKLFAGSFGTLGLILELTLRLHPLPP